MIDIVLLKSPIAYGENSTEPTLSRCRYSGHSVTPMNANVIYLGVRDDYLHKSQKNLTPCS